MMSLVIVAHTIIMLTFHKDDLLTFFVYEGKRQLKTLFYC